MATKDAAIPPDTIGRVVCRAVVECRAARCPSCDSTMAVQRAEFLKGVDRSRDAGRVPVAWTNPALGLSSTRTIQH